MFAVTYYLFVAAGLHFIHQSNGINEFRVFNGIHVNEFYERYSYLASLQYLHPIKKKFTAFAAVAIISEKYGITAAHCVHELIAKGEAQRLYVLSSSPFSTVGSDEIDEHLHRVLDIIIHPYYETSEIDIALVKVRPGFPEKLFGNRSLHFLPPFHQPPIGMICRFAGWGCINAEALKCKLPSNELQEMFPRLVPNRFCSRTAKSHEICTFAYNQTCTKGDSGGPLVCKLDNIDYLVGICNCGPNPPFSIGFNYYLNVAQVRDWIECVILEKPSHDVCHLHLRLKQSPRSNGSTAFSISCLNMGLIFLKNILEKYRPWN